MTTPDYPKALAAAREAHTYVKHLGMTRAEAALGDLLAALDAAQGEAVAWCHPEDLEDVKEDGYAHVLAFPGPKEGKSRVPLYLAPQAPPAAVPDGYVPVPVEPTQAMLDAVGQCSIPVGKEWLDQSNREVWATMLAAANKENNNG
ncbi:hypothetical protein [Ralstonia sp.]|uniref:hypothetical protein n=1 Tax=Ralstonia sp. TaxID=54061 RepID=UPI00257AF1B5|nr:hypothetical protein [Ralstonia sp.]MBA4282215.1 hypothetical protein [Ralstonia sp.]